MTLPQSGVNVAPGLRGQSGKAGRRHCSSNTPQLRKVHIKRVHAPNHNARWPLSLHAVPDSRPTETETSPARHAYNAQTWQRTSIRVGTLSLPGHFYGVISPEWALGAKLSCSTLPGMCNEIPVLSIQSARPPLEPEAASVRCPARTRLA